MSALRVLAAACGAPVDHRTDGDARDGVLRFGPHELHIRGIETQTEAVDTTSFGAAYATSVVVARYINIDAYVDDRHPAPEAGDVLQFTEMVDGHVVNGEFMVVSSEVSHAVASISTLKLRLVLRSRSFGPDTFGPDTILEQQPKKPSSIPLPRRGIKLGGL